jgi:Glycosyl hydrolases family 35
MAHFVKQTVRPTWRSFLPALLALAAVSPAFAADNVKTFAHPDRIRYDSQCLTIDGKDMVIFSGSFHYFRCPKELWRDRFTKLKEAGFNTVETYIAWNEHEVEMPADLSDFSKIDLKDADDWMTMAESFGFYIIIRPGPYICAEWERGGFPGWLVNKKPAQTKEPLWFRSDDPVFMAWSKHWLDAVCPVVAKHQITRKAPGQPGVILFQLENEYNYAQFSEPIKAAYVKSLAQDALAGGIDVPLFTCWTRGMRDNPDPVLSNIFDSCNFYPKWNVDSTLNDVRSLRAQQPDAPLMTTELQGGWFTEGLGAPPIRPDVDSYREDLGPAQINNLTLLMWAHGETLTNYYMAFGRTNLGDTAAQNISTSYDYSAPLRECGGVGEKFLRVKALGDFINEHGPKLARATTVACDVTTGSPDVSIIERQAADGSRYLFLRTNQYAQPRAGTIHLIEQNAGGANLTFAYQLEPFGSRVLYLPPGEKDPAKGEWLPKPETGPARPTDLPAPIKITDIQATTDPTPLAWHDAANHSLNALGIYDSRFVYYETTLTVTESELKSNPELNLAVDHPEADAAVAILNGQRLHALPDNGDRLFAASKALHPGDNSVLLLYENVGTPNGGAGMEKLAGITNVHLAPLVKDTGALQGWRMKMVARNAQPDHLPEVAADAPDADWTPTIVQGRNANQLKVRQSAVFRTTVSITADDLKAGRTALTFLRVDDAGTVFLNGEKLGEPADWSQAYTYDAAKFLHIGNNSLAIFVHNSDGAGGLGAVTLAQPTAVTVGKVGDLFYADVPPTLAANAPLLTTEQLSFHMPAAKSDQWVPWLVRVHATGNGFLYLNGHPLGRYWQAGQQKDFFLPDCWLNPGNANEANVITMTLREVDTPVAIQSAEVMPYTVYAEKR